MTIGNLPGSRSGFARNIAWNFIGTAAPVPIALVAIPALISGLGIERFGLLTIAWTLMGYFGLFDFGLARATTKHLAEALHREDLARARTLFWSSLAFHLFLGVIGAVVLFAVVPWIERTLTIQPNLREETVVTLYILTASVPLLVLTSVFRGVLEAVHRFDLVNAVKLPASFITYLGPLAALAFTNRLPPIVLLITVCRAVVLLTYLVTCFRALPCIRKPQTPELSLVRPLAAMGGWLTATTLMTPMIVSIDRFVIGSAVSVAAITIYAAPYEVVTKLWILSGSLLGVLFPAFSVLSAQTERLERLYWRAVIGLFLFTTPVAGIVIALAPDFFHVWLGPEIAREGATVARWLTIGVLANVVAQVPFTVLQATGHADATGKIQLAQIPMYVLAVWAAAGRWGVIGVAIVWSLRAGVDTALMFSAVGYRLRSLHAAAALPRVGGVLAGTTLFVIWCWHLSQIVAPTLVSKAIVVTFSAAAFSYITSRYVGGGLTAAAFLAGIGGDGHG